jgi:hypothetical protein
MIPEWGDGFDPRPRKAEDRIAGLFKAFLRQTSTTATSPP